MSQQQKPPSPTKHVHTSSHMEDDNQDMGEILSRRYGKVNIYMVVMVLLAAGIIWTAICTAEQIQQYHQDYRVLQDMKRQYHKLQVEHQRLLIEQQTFSATPQIANRAVTELGMFSPSSDDKLILQPSAPAEHSHSQQSLPQVSSATGLGGDL